MNHDEPPTMSQGERASYSLIWMWLAPLLLLPPLFLLLYLALGGSAPPPTNRASTPGQSIESGVETARQMLTRKTDPNACRSALQQINTELSEKPNLHPPALTNEQKNWLHDNLNLSREELSEVETNHYTRLDHHHLFRCFLMRDAAGALEVKGVRGKGGAVVREKPLDQAARAFAWVMREVRLRQRDGEEAPPDFVLRRGWGTALERALVFLALLEQLGEPDAPRRELLGFLLQTPDNAGGMRLWTCGVVDGEGKEVYLFDPYLGLPLPGPKGEGIATLSQLRQQKEVLAQLKVGGKYHYPVTREQARAAQALLVCPLSTLSPRMRYLQDKLLAPAVRVRLAADAAEDRERVQTACSAGAEKPTSVLTPKDRCTLLRRFLSVDEGGADTTLRQHRFMVDLVPWTDLPAAFLNERTFPQNSDLGIRVRSLFAASFINATMDAGFPRDLLLRGRFSSAVPALVQERDRWRNQLEQRANAVDLEKNAQQWVEHATRAYAGLLRAKLPQEREQAEGQVKALWDERHGLPIYVILNSAAAVGRNPEVAYQLGLCAQEQAEQLQARLDLQARAGATAHQREDVEKAQLAWQKALDAWKRFDEDYPTRPDVPTHPDVAAARRLRGRAESLLGDRKAAIASWKKLDGYKTDLEKIASLYLAQQLEKQSGSDKK